MTMLVLSSAAWQCLGGPISPRSVKTLMKGCFVLLGHLARLCSQGDIKLELQRMKIAIKNLYDRMCYLEEPKKTRIGRTTQAGENKVKTMIIRHSKHSVKTRHIDKTWWRKDTCNQSSMGTRCAYKLWWRQVTMTKLDKTTHAERQRLTETRQKDKTW